MESCSPDGFQSEDGDSPGGPRPGFGREGCFISGMEAGPHPRLLPLTHLLDPPNDNLQHHLPKKSQVFRSNRHFPNRFRVCVLSEAPTKT